MVHCRRIAARGQYLQIVMTALLRCQHSHESRDSLRWAPENQTS